MRSKVKQEKGKFLKKQGQSYPLRKHEFTCNREAITQSWEDTKSNMSQNQTNNKEARLDIGNRLPIQGHPKENNHEILCLFSQNTALVSFRYFLF